MSGTALEASSKNQAHLGHSGKFLTKSPEAFQPRDSLTTNVVRATGLEPEQGCPH